MKRIAFLSILFAALIEFAIERAKVDLRIVAVVAVVILLWNVAARALCSHLDSQKHDHHAFASRDIVCNSINGLRIRSSRHAQARAGFDGLFGER
jgi:hypothetical protein